MNSRNVNYLQAAQMLGVWPYQVEKWIKDGDLETGSAPRGSLPLSEVQSKLERVQRGEDMRARFGSDPKYWPR